jgi:hypothetical protein
LTTDNFCFYLHNRLIQTGGQLYSDTFPFSVPWDQVVNFSGGEDEEDGDQAHPFAVREEEAGVGPT